MRLLVASRRRLFSSPTPSRRFVRSARPFWMSRTFRYQPRPPCRPHTEGLAAEQSSERDKSLGTRESCSGHGHHRIHGSSLPQSGACFGLRIQGHVCYVVLASCQRARQRSAPCREALEVARKAELLLCGWPCLISCALQAVGS